jgi:hypothetical protein
MVNATHGGLPGCGFLNERGKLPNIVPSRQVCASEHNVSKIPRVRHENRMLGPVEIRKYAGPDLAYSPARPRQKKKCVLGAKFFLLRLSTLVLLFLAAPACADIAICSAVTTQIGTSHCSQVLFIKFRYVIESTVTSRAGWLGIFF